MLHRVNRQFFDYCRLALLNSTQRTTEGDSTGPANFFLRYTHLTVQSFEAVRPPKATARQQSTCALP